MRKVFPGGAASDGRPASCSRSRRLPAASRSRRSRKRNLANLLETENTLAHSDSAAWTSSRMESRTCCGRWGQALRNQLGSEPSSKAHWQCPTGSHLATEIAPKCRWNAAPVRRRGPGACRQPQETKSVASESLAGSIPAASIFVVVTHYSETTYENRGRGLLTRRLEVRLRFSNDLTQSRVACAIDSLPTAAHEQDCRVRAALSNVVTNGRFSPHDAGRAAPLLAS